MTPRRGITLVELLVVIGIIGLLLAITIPAVQRTRESARRTQCQNNLRQTILAVHSFHTAEGALPSFYNGTAIDYPLNEWDLFHMHSWRVPLLPYLEQSALHEQVDFESLATVPENLPVGQTVVPTFFCPSGGDPSEMGQGIKHGSIGSPPYTEADWYSVVRSDYDALAGIQEAPKPAPVGHLESSVNDVHWGIWGWPVFDSKAFEGTHLLSYRRGRFNDVADGLSNTIALVERGGKPIRLINGKPAPVPPHENTDYPGQVGWSCSNTFGWSINRDGIGVNEDNALGIYSVHSGGANVAIADGSVRFLSDATDFKTLISLFGRSDGGLTK
ncbi:MAG: DUF1559 domain-containing protein [Planctomycetaceae bacterium]